jgi:cytochrome c5
MRPTLLALLLLPGALIFIPSAAAVAPPSAEPHRSPIDLTLLPDGRRALTANHDARRTRAGWFSCHSCHPDGHTSGQTFDTLNDGGFGDAKLAPYTWHGWQKELSAAVHKSFVDTMQGEEPTAQDVRAVVAYLETLDHPPTPCKVDPAAVSRGKTIFEGKAHCSRCHPAPEYTAPRLHDVGLQADNGAYAKWNPPSLRGVWNRGPFLHDGRSASLQDLLTRWHTPDRIGGEPLSAAERADLIAFLNSL